LPKSACAWCSARWSPYGLSNPDAKAARHGCHRRARCAQWQERTCPPAPISPTGRYLPRARLLSEAGYARQTLTTTLDSRLQACSAPAAIARAPLGKAASRAGGDAPEWRGRRHGRRAARTIPASPFNRATQARRQPGSTFKLFVYLAALKEGWEPDDTIPNTEIRSKGGYRPKNFAGRDAIQATITLEDAFARSSNVAAVRLFNEVGDAAVIRTARDLGVTLAAGQAAIQALRWVPRP
jgi:penicillin-binding protein 1A